MNRSKTLEAMAIALYEHATGMKWSDGTGLTKGKMVEFAEVALTACESRLQAEGMTVVPRRVLERIVNLSDCALAVSEAEDALAASDGKALLQKAAAERSGANSNPPQEKDA